MAAADSVLVPLQCEFFALEGLSQLLETVEQVRRSINPELTIQGIVLTMFDGRNNLANQVVDDVRAHMGEKVYETIIPAQCPGLGGAVLRQAGDPLRPQMRRQPGLSAARLRGDSPRAAVDVPPDSIRFDTAITNWNDDERRSLKKDGLDAASPH